MTSRRWSLTGPAGGALVAVAVVVCAVGLGLGVAGGPLWLDEALSVEIAGRRAGSGLVDALRQDGAPPLYYLLLSAWTAALGTGTVAVRLLTVLLVPLALWLAWRLGRRLGGTAGGRAAVVVLAALPWTMRYGSETRMYLLVVVLVLAGSLALLAVRRTPSRRAVAALAGCVGALLLTHYWALFLLAVVGMWHLPGLLRRDAAAVRVVVALVLGGMLFAPWLPVFVFQVQHTGAPWADPAGLLDLVRTPTFWGGGPRVGRVWLALLLVPLLVVAAVRRRSGRLLAGVVVATLVLAFTAAAGGSGAYTGRYTAVVVPLVAVAAGLGALALPHAVGTAWLAVLVFVGATTGLPAVAQPRTSAGEVAGVFRSAASPGDVLLYCPDQLGPPVAREIGPGYDQVVYPTLAGPELVDWVDYAERHDAAVPAEVARRVSSLAGDRSLFVLKASGYRTLEADDGSSDAGDDCDALLDAVADLRGPGEHLFGELGTTGQLLFSFPPAGMGGDGRATARRPSREAGPSDERATTWRRQPAR
ncbi:MAG TPA: glycosyltransferase family 39 protein [Mycobacteriales bacterium]|nr:glycosyltransferase family 39 protein [Mycobacteriales bacterium]